MRAATFVLFLVIAFSSCTELIGQEVIKPYWVDVSVGRRLPQSQKYRLSVLEEFGLDKKLRPQVIESLKKPDQRIAAPTDDFEPVFGMAYWYLGEGKYKQHGFFTVPNLEEFNKRVELDVARREQRGPKAVVKRKETKTNTGATRTDLSIVVPKPKGVTTGWMDTYYTHQDGIAAMGGSAVSPIDLATLKPWLPQLRGKQPFAAIDFDQISNDKMSWLTHGLLQRAAVNLGVRDGAVIEHIADQFFGKNSEAKWLEDATELVMWADWPDEEGEQLEVEATLKFRPDSDAAKLVASLGKNAQTLSLSDNALASGSFSFHIPKQHLSFLSNLITGSPLLEDAALAKKLKSTLEAGILEGTFHVGSEKTMPTQFAFRYLGEAVESSDLNEVKDNILAPDEVTNRSGSPLEEALNLLTDSKTKSQDGFFFAASSAESLVVAKAPKSTSTPNRLIEIKVDLSPLFTESRLEQTRKTFVEIEDWWDFFTYDNRYWSAFRSTRTRQAGTSRMTLAQFIQQPMFYQTSTLRREQISIATHLSADRDFSAHLTLDVIPNGLKFRLTTSRDTHRFWLARKYATQARTAPR
jgi:hypothetical protein